MEHLSDSDLVNELLKRLKEKDKAYHDLVGLTKRLEALNDRLVESEKVKSHFLSNIRNEINNPLTSVLTMCELLISNAQAPDPDTLKSVVSTIHKEAFNLDFQMRNIFAAAELEAGESVPSISTVDIESLIKSSLDSFSHKAQEKKINLVFEMSDELKSGHLFGTDSEKLERVLLNLLSNAIEYSFEGKPVEVKAWKENGALKVSVKDYGIGIDKDYHEAIFERFKQLDTGVTKSHSGHGLGLSITRAALEMLNGTMSLDSSKGSGAVFTITIPEAKAQAEAGTFSVDGNNFFFDTDGERF